MKKKNINGQDTKFESFRQASRDLMGRFTKGQHENRPKEFQRDTKPSPPKNPKSGKEYINLAAAKWVRRTRVTSAPAKSVLRCLADHADKYSGEAYPCLSTIAEETQLNQKTIRKSLVSLIRSHHISKTGVRTGRTGQVNIYRVNYEEEFEGNNNDANELRESKKIVSKHQVDTLPAEIFNTPVESQSIDAPIKRGEDHGITADITVTLKSKAAQAGINFKNLENGINKFGLERCSTAIEYVLNSKRVLDPNAYFWRAVESAWTREFDPNLPLSDAEKIKKGKLLAEEFFLELEKRNIDRVQLEKYCRKEGHVLEPTWGMSNLRNMSVVNLFLSSLKLIPTGVNA